VTSTQAAVVGAVLGAHAAAIVGLYIVFGRIRERVTRLEEWVRQAERRKNGSD
jgi:hypothetical protein